MIEFQEVRYKNLLSTGNQFTVIPLNKHKTTLIVGKNGSGKSTILDAIMFGLFGKPFRNINKPQLVNSITQKNLLVEVDFRIGKSQYTVRRGIKPVIFEVIKNGTLLNQDADQRDYQDVLEKQILKLNIKSFRQISVLGSASFIPFMALTTGQRREVIEDLLDLQIFTTMNVLLKQRISDNNDHIRDLENHKEIIQEKIKIYHKHMEQVQKNNAELIAAKQKDYDLLIKELEGMKVEDDKLVADLESHKLNLKANPDRSKEIDKLERMEDKILLKLRAAEKEMKFFQENLECPTCGQLIDSDFKDKHFIEKDNEAKKLWKGVRKLENDMKLLQEEQKVFESIQAIVNELEEARGEISVRVREILFKLKQLENDMEMIRNQVTDYHGERIEQLNDELQNLEEQYQQAMETKQTYSTAASLLKDDGIKSKIIKQYIPIINKLINKYLSSLDFFVQFELDENFEETMKSRYRDVFSYESFSEGEKKRINLAIIFTWRAIAKLRNSANTNLFLLDEVFDSSLDLTGMDDVLKLLLSLKKDNTIIISHNQQTVSDKFEHTIVFEKKQNFSRVVTK